jgi:hypothetical protein
MFACGWTEVPQWLRGSGSTNSSGDACHFPSHPMIHSFSSIHFKYLGFGLYFELALRTYLWLRIYLQKANYATFRSLMVHKCRTRPPGYIHLHLIHRQVPFLALHTNPASVGKITSIPRASNSCHPIYPRRSPVLCLSSLHPMDVPWCWIDSMTISRFNCYYGSFEMHDAGWLGLPSFVM